MTASLPAQTIRPTLWCLTGLVLGALLIARLHTLTHDRLTAENDQLRRKLVALADQHNDTLRRLESVNGELAVLREQAKQGQDPRTENQGPPAAGGEKPGAARAAVASEIRPVGAAANRLTLEDVPAQVQAALVRKAGPLEVKELELLTENGQWVYQVQGLTSDGRRVGLRLSPDGAVVSGKSEVTVEALPNPVREAVSQTWGVVDVHNAREILQQDQAIYELGGQLADGRKVSVSLAAEGTLLSAETEVFPDNLPQPVHNAIAGNVGAGANLVIRQVYADERFTYHVGVKTETEKTRLVFGQDGTLVGSETWFRPPKPSE